MEKEATATAFELGACSGRHWRVAAKELFSGGYAYSVVLIAENGERKVYHVQGWSMTREDFQWWKQVLVGDEIIIHFRPLPIGDGREPEDYLKVRFASHQKK